jgi:hypothetical protein
MHVREHEPCDRQRRVGDGQIEADWVWLVVPHALDTPDQIFIRHHNARKVSPFGGGMETDAWHDRCLPAIALSVS